MTKFESRALIAKWQACPMFSHSKLERLAINAFPLFWHTSVTTSNWKTSLEVKNYNSDFCRHLFEVDGFVLKLCRRYLLRLESVQASLL